MKAIIQSVRGEWKLILVTGGDPLKNVSGTHVLLRMQHLGRVLAVVC